MLRRDDVVPSWERAHYESYPPLAARGDTGRRGGWLSRLTAILAALAILGLAVALIILAPGLLSQFGLAPSPTPSPTTVAVSPTATAGEATASPTAAPSPTALDAWQEYTIQAGDNLFRIAARFGITYEQLLAANPQITDPNYIRAGDVIRIPPLDFTPPPTTAPPTASPS
ncbi:MAG: LysM peptidoglycan-binding domain-containing protein [Chloroflexota bacterium]|nr:LysM peptidoglycan-binding domain-containing protein [Chloroflexota bacterium]